MEDLPVINNEEQLQFEIHSEGEMAFLVYRFYNSDIALMHTQVPDKISGKGIASTLAHHAFEWAKEHNRKVKVYCPFVAAYLKRHPQYEVLIDKNL